MKSRRIFFALLLCLFVISTFFCCGVYAESSSLSCYSGQSRYFSPRETFKPVINIYAANQDYLTFEAWKLTNFSLKNGEFAYSGDTPDSPGKKVFYTTVHFFSGDSMLRKRCRTANIELDAYPRKGYNSLNGRFMPPISETGVYLVRIKGNKDKWEEIFVASPMGMIVKHTPDFAEGFLCNQKTNEPIPNVDVKLYDSRGFRFMGKTNELGWFGFKTGKDLQGLITVMAHKGDAYAIYSFSAAGSSKLPNVYLYTDRPVYRPGQTVYFKGIVTKLENKNHILLKDKKVKVTLKDARYNTLKTLDMKSSDNGSYDGEFIIPSDTPLGRYTIMSDVDESLTYNLFEVQEYRKPKFEVFVKPLKSTVIQGDEATVEVRARYYFGNPVKGGTLTYEITGSSDPLKVPGEYYYNYDSSYSNNITRGTVELDEIGKAVIKFKTGNHNGKDYRYRIFCVVKDKANESIEGLSSINVPASSRRVALSVTPYYVIKGTNMKITAYTVDADNKPISSKVSLDFSREIWNHEKRIYETKKLKTLEMKTLENGYGVKEIAADQSGRIIITAAVEDESKRVCYVHDSIWVSGSLYYNYDYPRLEIIRDKRNYSAGDTAKILVNSSHKGMFMFVTLEQDKIYKRWIFKAADNSIPLEIPIKQEYAPGVYIKVSFVADGNFVSGQEFIPVASKNRFIDVTIDTDKGIYSPGETAICELKTKDEEGNPVPAEVSIGVVDDSIYAIEPDSTPNIKTYYYGRRPNFVKTDFSIPREYPGGSFQKVPEKTPVVPETRIRKNFKDTAYWNPRVFTDEKGYARIPVELADNLTRWRTTVRAFTGDMKVGSNLKNVIARKEMTLRLAAPRFFRYKDKITVSSVISNDSKATQEIEVSFKIRGASLNKENAGQSGNESLETITLEPGEEKKVDYNLNITPYPADGKIVITASAKAKSGLFDGEEMTYPVELYGSLNRKYMMETIKNSYSQKIDIPNDVIPGSLKMKLGFSPSIASNMMGSLDYMAQYPYGCTEQTMSRFLPLCVLKGTLSDLNIKDEEIEKKIPDMVLLGFKKLYGYQHSDGGWGWWKDDNNEPFLTAFVIYGFYKAEKAGFKVDPKVLERGLRSLANQYANVKDPNTCAFMLHSLGVHGKATAKMAEELMNDRAKMNNYALALLAITLFDLNEKEKAEEVLQELENKAITDDVSIYWESGSSDWGWMKSDIEATSVAMTAYLKIKPDSGKTAKILNWLINQKHGNHWVSTKTTGYVIMAMSEYLLKSGEMNADFTAKVKLNGKELDTFTFDKESVFMNERVITVPFQFPNSGEGLKKGTNTLEITREGNGTLYYTGSLEYYTERDPQAETADFEVERFIFVKNEKGELIPLNRDIKAGEELVVDIKVNPKKSNYSYVMIEDPLPSGFEVSEIRPLRDFYYSNAEKRDNRVVFFRTYLWKTEKGTYFSYVCRAERPGKLNVMPVKVELMYNPMIKGNGAGKQLIIEK